MKNSKSGVALFLVLVSLLLIGIVIAQVAYTGNIDSKINRGTQHRLQSYYLAQSAAKMGLLRIHMYREMELLLAANKDFANLVPQNMRSLIWSFPLPSFPLDGQQSSAPGTFVSIIKGEGSKIPINILDGDIHRMPLTVAKPSEAKAEADLVRKEIQGILDQRAETDPNFKEKLEKEAPGAFVDSLVDWFDFDDRLVQGGDENSVYDRKTLPYKPRNDRTQAASEVSLVNLWEDDVAKPFRTEFSTVNLKPKVNCNTLSLERFKIYSKNELTDEDLSLIAKRRLEAPFTSMQECQSFIKSSPDMSGNARYFEFPKEILNNGYNKETSFMIEGSGTVGDSRSIVRLYARIDEEAPKQSGSSSSADATKPPPDPKFLELRVIRFEEGAAQ